MPVVKSTDNNLQMLLLRLIPQGLAMVSGSEQMGLLISLGIHCGLMAPKYFTLTTHQVRAVANLHTTIYCFYSALVDSAPFLSA